MFRGFIAVDIEVKEQLREILKKLKETNADLKVVEEENIHLTLKFLGDTKEELIEKIENAIKNSVCNITSFNANLRKIGVFPNIKFPRVVWIGLENAENLVKIAEKLENNLQEFGFKKENRKFSPHITIARLRSQRNKENLQKFIKENEDKEFYEVNVNCIKLKKSVLKPSGAEYSDVRVVNLV